MPKECVHSIEFESSLRSFHSIKCNKCGMIFRLKRKYACLGYMVGLIGLIPFYFLRNMSNPWWLDIMYSFLLVLFYVAFNVFLEWLFYQYLKKLDQSKLYKYIVPKL